MKLLKHLVLVIALMFSGVLIYVYSGNYPIGADVPHNVITQWLLETLREKSIARAAKDIVVPADLNIPKRLLAGGADYNDMCSGCHLKPGRNHSDISLGLYPAPPNFTLSPTGRKVTRTQNQQRFWAINMALKRLECPPGVPGIAMREFGI
ncbi:MAG: hypothetical protein ACI9Y1_003157 [Lentisphaeria bacterium]|jgi:hypothetical protein